MENHNWYKLIEEFFAYLTDVFDRMSGNTSSWKIVSGATAYIGKAKYIIVLKASTFTVFNVNNEVCLTKRGLSATEIPALTILSAGKGKYITAVTNDAAGLFQVFE